MISTPSGPDRRAHPRIEVQRPIELWRDDEPSPSTAIAVNLSQTGIFVAGCRMANVGDQITCRLLFAPREPIEVACRVVWVRNAPLLDEPPGMGLLFEDVTETSSERLEQLVERLNSVTSTDSVAIDPFCESGTWARDAIPSREEIPVRDPTRVLKLALLLSVVLSSALVVALAFLLLH